MVYVLWSFGKRVKGDAKIEREVDFSVLFEKNCPLL